MKNLLNKKNSIILLTTILVILVFSNSKTRFKISRLILSHELSILPNLVFKKINNLNRLDMYDAENKQKSAIILSQYVYEHTLPIEVNLDDGASWKLLHGSIWCDGVSDIFNRLLEVNETRSYITFLYNDENVSPHTINFVDFLDQSLVNDRNSSLEKKTLFIFDTQNNYKPINKEGKVVNIDYMLNNKIEFRSMEKLDSDNLYLNLLENDKGQLWDRNIFGEQNSFIRNISKKIVKYFPNFIFESLVKIAIFINPELEKNYKSYLFARFEHVMLNYSSALIKYQKLKEANIYSLEAQKWIERIKKFNI